ncbi:MAG TPA: type VI secretion system membrane subunit TssM [Telluria sp.]|jgi:type VI secretion system protein ImpL
MKKLLSLLFARPLMTLLGLGAIAALVWLVGPLVAIADVRPLEPARVRMAVIGLIAGLWAGKLLCKRVRAQRANAQLMAGLLAQRSAPAADPPGPGAEEIAALAERFEQAVAILKQARHAVGPGGLSGRLARFRRQWIYELPWYIFIGAPGAGKTTALVNSGLQFPLAERLGTGPIGGVGGTRHCDWWFTNEAVLLDTAGRYTTHESDQAADSAAWTGFLQLLKKYRSRRPINGVLLTLSVAELLEQSPAQQEAHLDALRRRIGELHEQLNIRFPVYVLVTKADLLTGFMEFFSDLSKEEREQVWGATLAHHPEGTLAQADFSSELAALEQRINERLIERLQQEHDPHKRARLYVFPQQLTTLRLTLAGFLERLFAPSRFAEPPLVRGVYFTSATQEGTPIDRIMGSLGRALRLERELLAPPRAGGKSFFLTRLLKDVVFQEAGLAGTNLRRERRRWLVQAGALGLALLLACGALGAWSISYLRNRAYVAELDVRRAALAEQVGRIGTAPSTDLVALLPVLDALRRLASTPLADRAPWSMGFGLYQGDKLDAAAQDAYRKLLRDTVLPRLALRIEHQLRTDARTNPELLYAGLKAYIMLHDARHADPDALKAFITADWETTLAREVGKAQRRALEAHLDALLGLGGAAASTARADGALIADTRNAIARTPLAERIYNRLKRQGVAASLPEFTVANAAGPSAALVFTRASGQPLTSGVPGLYSVDGYYKAFASESARVTAQLADEAGWVLGAHEEGPPADPAAHARLLDDVRRLYLRDYARIWEAFVDDIKLVKAANLQQSIELARILSAPSSPLPLLLRAIVKEVTLVRLDEADKSAIAKAGDKVKSTRDDLLKLFGQQQPAASATRPQGPEELVDRRFEDLRRMVRGQAGAPAPIDATVSLINELYTLLTATEAALRGGTTPPPSEVPNRIKAEGSRMPEPVRSLLLTLSGAGASQAMGLARTNLSQAMHASVFEFCHKAIGGRYPFTRNSARDVTREDFARLFAAGGLIDEFFQKNLAPFVNTATRPWSFRNMGDASLGAASGALVQFQRAQAIREVFFRGAAQGAALRLEFTPLAMDASITQFILDVDGQLVKYSHGPQVPVQVQWPGPRGSMQVRLQLSPPGAGASGQVFEGPWALFRMFDQVRLASGAQPEKFVATFDVDGRTAQFDVFTGSVQNPFRLRELEQFQCPGQL